jgi:hypothetical protein
MGLHDRDYMKGPSEDDRHRTSSPDARLDAFFSGFLDRHPRFFTRLLVGLAALALLAIIISKFANKSH